MTLVALWVIVSLRPSQENTTLEDRVAIVGFLLTMAWFLLWTAQHYRYRHAYRTTYVADAEGILVETQSYRGRIRWHEFEIAEHFPVFYFARLRTPRLAKPVVLFLTTENKVATARSELARRLIEMHMGSKFRTRWL